MPANIAFLRGIFVLGALATLGQTQGKTPPASKPADSKPAESKPARAPKSLAIGDPAPAFRVKDHTGKERTLAEFKGRRLVLWFYPKASTPG
jgi:cytochrome oxidase Cu insertion factor (SCO1/SenC/PrrC family)